MKVLKIMPIILILCGVSILSPGCASKAAPAPEGQVVTVQRGNLSKEITGVGNLALSGKVDLAFEMDGTVEEVLIEAGKPVKEGQLLAKLDTLAWEEDIAALERTVVEAERTVTDMEREVTKKERGVRDAEDAVTDKELAVLEAQASLNDAKVSLEQKQQETTDRLEIESAEIRVEKARRNLEKARIAVVDAATVGIDDAKIAVEDAKVRVDDARKALEDAKEALAEVVAASPEVKAPFDGFITVVNVEGGDEVKKGTVAVTIADPTKFEAEIMVSEMNILYVTLNETASVKVEAMQGVSLPAEVTHIAPSATIQSGVVNYKVKVELTSMQPVSTQRQTGTTATGNITSRAPSGRSGQASGSGNLTALGSGNLTQEQIDQMRQQRQQAQGRQTGGQSSQAAAALTQNSQLAEGMTVTVSIITQERTDVLLVPIKAVISRGSEAFVQVLKDGVTEERSVQAGISNLQYVEITSGLSEGEQVLVPKGTTTTTPTTTQQGQQGQSGGIPKDIQRILR